MAYAPHTLLLFRGTLGSTSGTTDMWQIGLRFKTLGTGAGTSVPQANVDKAYAAAATYFARVDFSTATKFEECRGAVIGTDGKPMGAWNVKAATSAITGGSNSVLHPWSVSTAVTLDAGGTRRGRFGRVYLPPQAFTVDNSGQTTSTWRTTELAAFKTFVQGIQGTTSGGEDLRLVVASEAGGTLRDVTSLRIGSVPDTQRRRDNRVRETYTLTTL